MIGDDAKRLFRQLARLIHPDLAGEPRGLAQSGGGEGLFQGGAALGMGARQLGEVPEDDGTNPFRFGALPVAEQLGAERQRCVGDRSGLHQPGYRGRVRYLRLTADRVGRETVVGIRRGGRDGQSLMQTVRRS